MNIIFFTDVAANYILLLGVIWSIALPQKRVWPPPKKWSWQYFSTWILFSIVFLCNICLIVLDWNTWIIPNEVRLFVGIPVMITGMSMVTWGIVTLGVKNTSGLKDRFVIHGPYRYTRNPQYLGDMFLFLGISFISNSLYVLIVHLLIILVFILTPLCEETWLEEQYGEEYKKYKKITTRFL